MNTAWLQEEWLQMRRRLLARIAEGSSELAETVLALDTRLYTDPARFAAFGLPVLPDPVPGQPGPLAGVLAGMDWAASLGLPGRLTVAGDTPFPPPDLAARLRAAGPFALAASPDESGASRLHPTVGLWPVALRGPLRASLQAG